VRDGVVIIGAGHAGVQAADSLRERGYAGPVTVVAGESHPPYSRPPVSKQLLDHTVDPAPTPLRAPGFYRERGIELVRTRAERIDRDARLLHLADGRVVRYDHVVLATGARARTLPVPGADLPNVLTLRTVDDALALRPHLVAGARVVVVGGGFVGLEVASAARRQGAEVTLLERGDRLLRRAVSAATADRIVEHHRGTGVRLGFGEEVAGLVERGGRVVAVRTATGDVLPADVVVVGIGGTPEDRLARTARLPTRDGVVVDQWLTTGDPRISAIGDCAVVREPLTGTVTRLESVQNASDQARYVADLLSGATSRPYRALPWFWSDQGDLRLQMVLRTPGHDREVAVGRSVLLFDGGLLTGVESLNDPTTHMAARRLLEHAAPTDTELASADYDVRVLAKRLRRPVQVA
jgi:3-phenylpropionate/trans-cinnamate dioxygenase ferredoxin reductase component